MGALLESHGKNFFNSIKKHFSFGREARKSTKKDKPALNKSRLSKVSHLRAGGDDETRTRVQNDKEKTFYENSLILFI